MELTTEQLEAITKFAAVHGRSWKSELRRRWEGGSYFYGVLGGADPAALQQIRNDFGPSWLVRFKLPAESEESMIAAVRAFARSHYNLGGWDVLVECWLDGDILEAISDAGARNAKQAIRACGKILRIHNEVREDIYGTAF
jgi:hypothetical protein